MKNIKDKIEEDSKIVFSQEDWNLVDKIGNDVLYLSPVPYRAPKYSFVEKLGHYAE